MGRRGMTGRSKAIERLTETTETAGMGGKAGHLGWLISHGVPVPPTWVIRFGTDRDELVDLVRTQLDGGGLYAVRSSATVEDGFESSYAGQFATELDVATADVLAAVDTIRASATGARVSAYRDHLEASERVAMNVVVQQMVPARAAGVAFSRNPITGLNEVVVEAVQGRGDHFR